MARRKLPRHLTWLESFAAAVETGSLEAAAQRLGLGRSVVSEHLSALETALAKGRPLLERGPGRRIRTTVEGEKLYAAAHAPLHQLELGRLEDVVSAEPSLRIGLNHTLSEILLPRIASAAARAGVKLGCMFGGPYWLVREVQARQLDLALGFTPLPRHEGVSARRLAHLGFVVISSARAEIARRTGQHIRVADLAGRRFVDWLRSDPYGDANAARFEAAGIAVDEVARVESMRQLYPCLRAYRACAIAPDLRPFAPFPDDLEIRRLSETPAQHVDVVALWPASGLRAEAANVLEELEGSIAKPPSRPR